MDIDRKNKLMLYINESPFLEKLNMQDFEIKPFDKIQGFNFIQSFDNGIFKTLEDAENDRLWTIYHELSRLKSEYEENKRKEQELIDKKNRENLQGFEEQFTKMKLGKVLTVLEKSFFFKGNVNKTMTRREFVEKYYNDMELEILNDSYMLGGFDIGETAYDYCNFLKNK